MIILQVVGTPLYHKIMPKPSHIVMQNSNLNPDEFLLKAGLKAAERKPLPGDASHRRYERIIGDGASYMLMIAPPEKEDVKPFLSVARILLNNGLHAPKILAEDALNGYLLLEDLGDDLYSKVLSTNHNELELYKLAVEVLESLPKKADVPEYTTQRLMDETLLFMDWFAVSQNPDAPREEFAEIVRSIVEQIDPTQKTLVLRDYHADNLMWLPNEEGLMRVGLLDFQDAVIGHPAYDLVSLLEDARRDVSKETVSKILSGRNMDFMRDYFILGAQRNLKIIGIFNRLKKRDNKDGYLKFLPRVWAHLKHDLEHPAMHQLRDWLNKYNLLA